MRRTYMNIGSLLLIVSCLITSCSNGGTVKFRNDKNEKMIIGLFSAIEEQNEEAIRGLFSKKAINSDCDFDKKVDELFDFIQGELVTYDDWGDQVKMQSTMQNTHGCPSNIHMM